MAVFVCATDESADDTHFFYAGWAAPVDIWDGCFAQAWNERVLNGPPQIPYLHMTEIRDWNWQERYGLTPWQASARIDAAADVLRSTGGLTPVVWSVRRKEWDDILRQPFTPRYGQRTSFEPDYLMFLYVAYMQLDWLHVRYGDQLEKVDFWVEENGSITRHMRGFHGSIKHGLKYIARAHLAPLVGTFLPVPKERIPAQAADMLAWHARNHQREALDRVGRIRYAKLVVGGSPNRYRYGASMGLNADILRKLARLFAENPDALNRPPDDDPGNDMAS